MMPAMRRPTPAPTVQAMRFPPPIGGVNTVTPASVLPLTDCMLAYNLIAAEYGLRTRLGYTEWCTTLEGVVTNQVRTILPFTGSASSGTKDRLFATTEAGIYGVTASSSGPTLLVAFPVTAGDAGYGISTVMVTAAGHFLIYTDEVNGLYVYTESTDTWAAVTMGGGGTQISGVDPATFAFCVVWKNRLWFIPRDGARAWYMAAGSIYGAAASFDFGNKFRSGGDLRGLWSWTIDGGAGMDDKLVGISGGGDVVIYEGTDPASALTFGLSGIWYAGAVPAGRNLATSYGGDLLLLSRLGVRPLSTLVIGNQNYRPDQYDTHKIGNTLNALAGSVFGLKGWSIRLHPEDNAIIVTVPTTSGAATTQLVMSVATKGWTAYRDLPIYSCEAWGGKLYFGTTDGKVCVNTGYLDNVLLGDPNSYSAVQWSLVTSFQALGQGRMCQVQTIRPTFMCDGGTPSYSAAARYKYDLTEAVQPAGATAGGDTWDHGVWDTAKWAGAYSTTQAPSGAVGIGPEVGVAICGSAKSRTVLVGMDLLYTVGGFL